LTGIVVLSANGLSSDVRANETSAPSLFHLRRTEAFHEA
jgi:hypothetical protein